MVPKRTWKGEFLYGGGFQQGLKNGLALAWWEAAAGIPGRDMGGDPASPVGIVGRKGLPWSGDSSQEHFAFFLD